MKIAGVILAAGRSTRMGRDKALLPYCDTTFLGSLVSVFLEQLDPVVVVLGHHADEIRPAAGSAQVVINEDYDRGMLSSLQAGLCALPAGAEAAAFTLVDHPGLRPDTLRQLIEKFSATRAPLALPRFQGERGHPAILSRALIEELLALPATASPKPVLRARYGEAAFLDVDDPAVTVDIDRPEDLRRL